jgi:hypothetical protein
MRISYDCMRQSCRATVVEQSGGVSPRAPARCSWPIRSACGSLCDAVPRYCARASSVFKCCRFDRAMLLMLSVGVRSGRERHCTDRIAALPLLAPLAARSISHSVGGASLSGRPVTRPFIRRTLCTPVTRNCGAAQKQRQQLSVTSDSSGRPATPASHQPNRSRRVSALRPLE